MHLSTCIFVYLTHLTFVFHISHSSPTVSHSETTSHLSHMWLGTLYLTFYGYLGYDMVKLSCLLLKLIVEPYNTSHYIYLCMHHTSHVSFFTSHTNFPTSSQSEITSYLSHMYHRTSYLAFYGYLVHDMVKLSCL